MGLGDQLIGSGLARGAAARGKRIAFGDGQKIIWDHNSELIFRGNPNIAPPGQERWDDIEWMAFHRGNRIYNRQGNGRWIWNLDFKVTPGEVFLNDVEHRYGEMFGAGDFILIEPNVPEYKTSSPNKQWPKEWYAKLAKRLIRAGFEVRQFYYNGSWQLPGAKLIKTPTFRHALAVMQRARLYIGPEGGLHHGAAAVGTSAVVLFGGFIPPSVTGYDFHTNLTGGANACGSLAKCSHCVHAMNAISIDEVESAARNYLNRKAA